MAIIIRRFLLEESRPKFVTTDPQSVLLTSTLAVFDTPTKSNGFWVRHLCVWAISHCAQRAMSHTRHRVTREMDRSQKS